MTQKFYIFKNKEKYIYLDEKFIDLVNFKKDIEILGRDDLSPVFFENGIERLMVLPIRMSTDVSGLKELK